MSARLSPRSQTIAFRAWQWCEAFGWEHTLAEIAGAIDESHNAVRAVFVLKGWMGRVRKVSPDYAGGLYHRPTFIPGDSALGDLEAWA
ncbi:hypothetical protein PARHAE_00732 [Paracoccus haematequi]|uniref:Uncharacterized protein n=1 Tax=Paracoccus haematequi TaxID=2491866 RepID=A0A3S4CWX4_9RHOB|nr:hypothetical protein [Paracoccus haematequi]VDS07555.1 hypothetical protein PARHAE_00732 [Paracoccus haematequi]